MTEMQNAEKIQRKLLPMLILCILLSHENKISLSLSLSLFLSLSLSMFAFRCVCVVPYLISFTEVILQPCTIWDFRDRNAFTLYDRKTCIFN